jgi:hypothetical protein
MGYFPWFFAEQVQFIRKVYAVDDHTAGNVGKVELLAVVCAQQMFGLTEMVFQQLFELFQDFGFLPMK